MLRTNTQDYGSIIPDWYVPDVYTIKTLGSEGLRLWRLQEASMEAHNCERVKHYSVLCDMFLKAHNEAMNAFIRDMHRSLYYCARVV